MAPRPRGSTPEGVNGYGATPPQRMALHGRSWVRYPFYWQTLCGGPITAGTFVPRRTGAGTTGAPDMSVRAVTPRWGPAGRAREVPAMASSARPSRTPAPAGGPAPAPPPGRGPLPPAPRTNTVFRELRGARSPGEFAAVVRRAARDIGERVSCDARYIGRVEAGEIRCPNYAYERVFLHMFPGRTLADLGFAPRSAVRGRGRVRGRPYRPNRPPSTAPSIRSSSTRSRTTRRATCGVAHS